MRLKIQNLPDPAPLIASFRADLHKYDAKSILRKRVLFGDCYTMPARETEYHFLQEVADHFEIHPTKATIVGSGKLGFSIAPQKRYKPFGDKSDIDVVLVDSELFERLWWEIHEAVSGRYDWQDRKEFSDYLMRGWIRPDKFPDVDGKFVSGWWDYFKGLSRDMGVKIRGAVYKDWRFFEAYHTVSIAACISTEQMKAVDAVTTTEGKAK